MTRTKTDKAVRRKAALWDALTERLLSAKLSYSRGRLVVEGDDPRQAVSVLERVLGVVAAPGEAHE